MVEQDAIAGIQPVGLAVVHRNPISVELGHGVGRAGIEGRTFALRHFLHQPVQLRSRGLIQAGFFRQAQNANGFQEAQGAQAIHIGAVFWGVERHLHVRHRTEVINLIGLHLLYNANQVGGIRQIAVVQFEAHMLFVGVLVEVVDAVGVEHRRAPLDAVNLVAFFEQQLGQVGSILSRNASNECAFHRLIANNGKEQMEESARDDRHQADLHKQYMFIIFNYCNYN